MAMHDPVKSDREAGYRTALSRARGLGAAKRGVGDFILERTTSVALAPLCLWAVWEAVRIAPLGYAGAVEALRSPVNAVLAALLIVVSALHMQAGMKVIVEDYIHKPGSKVALLLLNAGACCLAAAGGVFAVLKVALLGAGAR